VELMAPFPDAEDVVMTVLSSIASTVQTTAAEETGPVIQVRQTGGTSTKIDDRPVVEVGCIAVTYAQAKTMAATAEQLMLAAARTKVPGVPGHPSGVFVDKVSKVTSAREITMADPEKRRKTASYRLVLRRPTS